jgi:hydrogenase expression/formation protein HypC
MPFDEGALLMCLAIPGKVIEVYEEHGLRMGRVDFGGTVRRACLEHVSEAVLGDYVLVHVGFALSRVDPEEAERTYRLLEDLGQLGELEAPEPP